MDITVVAAVGIASAVLAVLLRQYRPEQAVMISLGCAALVLGVLLTWMLPAFTLMQETAERTGVSATYVKILLKCLGVCLLGDTACQLCREAGQLTVAFYMELSTRVVILLLTLPLFRDLIRIVLTLLD